MYHRYFGHYFKTPYQGRKRCFGHYKCCKEWTSGYSWADTCQQCSDCSKYIYPYKQSTLKKTNKRGASAHIQALCAKCCHRELSCQD